MLKYKQGDLITAAKNGEVGIVAHCCNCFNAMNSGIARALAQAFPEVYEADQATVKGDINKTGTFTKTYNVGGLPGNITPTVYNLYGQYNYGRSGLYLRYPSLGCALASMATEVRSCNKILEYQGEPPEKVGMPKIGCGLAGGDWEIVSRMIEQIFEDIDVTIYTLD